METVWFVAIAVLWIGYVFLEGFDLGVGMLLPFLPRDERRKRVMLETIGPVWDGNEVWLVTAVGATFAAFPRWYAALLSTVYLPLVAVLLGLIVRGVAFEYRGMVDNPRWRTLWTGAIFAGSVLPALGVGFALSATATGLPLDAAGNRVGGPLAVLTWHTALGALAFVGFSLANGAAFLALKTEGDVRVRARRFAGTVGVLCLLPLAGFALDVQQQRGTPVSWLLGALGIVTVLIGLLRLRRGAEGQAFAGFGGFGCLLLASIFVAMYPVVLPSTLDPEWNLTIGNASSAHYTLTVLTWMAAFGLPLVLAYQGWTYWVFRRRIGVAHVETAAH